MTHESLSLSSFLNVKVPHFSQCLRRHKILQSLLLGESAEYPDYTLRIVGHSLGAGIGKWLPGRKPDKVGKEKKKGEKLGLVAPLTGFFVLTDSHVAHGKDDKTRSKCKK